MAAYIRETGAAPDVIVEAVGAPGLIQHCIQMAPSGCRILVVGACMEPDTILPSMAISKDLEIRFTCGFDMQDFKFALEMAGKGRISPKMLISNKVPLSGLPEAFEALKSPTDQCKVMMVTE